MTFEIHFHTMRLQMAGYEGRITVYVSLTLGRRTWWLQRWDKERSKPGFALPGSDGKMVWTAGTRVSPVYV